MVFRPCGFGSCGAISGLENSRGSQSSPFYPTQHQNHQGYTLLLLNNDERYNLVGSVLFQRASIATWGPMLDDTSSLAIPSDGRLRQHLDWQAWIFRWYVLRMRAQWLEGQACTTVLQYLWCWVRYVQIQVEDASKVKPSCSNVQDGVYIIARIIHNGLHRRKARDLSVLHWYSIHL